MKFDFHPSPAVTARSDETIRVCVKRMAENKVGSVIVLSSDENQKLLGIFTERDLLQRSELIQSGKYWDKAIGSIMTRKLVSLDVNRLQDAPHLMIRYGFRHVPVTVNDSKKGPQLLGVVSMRDLFVQLWRKANGDDLTHHIKAQTSVMREVRVGVLSQSSYFNKLFAAGLSQYPHVSVTRLKSTLLDPSLEQERVFQEFDVLILDIDGIDKKTWIPLFRFLRRLKNAPYLVLAFDPLIHEPSLITAMKKLAHAQAISAFSKPINVFSLFSKMEPIFEKLLLGGKKR